MTTDYYELRSILGEALTLYIFLNEFDGDKDRADANADYIAIRVSEIMADFATWARDAG